MGIIRSRTGSGRKLAEWFVRTTAVVSDRWNRPGLGEWDVRALVGHTSRSLLTYRRDLPRPAGRGRRDRLRRQLLPRDEGGRRRPGGRGARTRGRTALGADPAAAVAQIATRVLALVETQDGTTSIRTIAGDIRLRDYLPTRTFELAVHTADLATALDLPPDVPATAAAQALYIVAEPAIADGLAGPLLLAVTGRTGLPTGYSVL